MNYEEVKAAVGFTNNTNSTPRIKADFSPGVRVDSVIRHLLDRIEALEKEIAVHNNDIYDIYDEIQDLKKQ